MYDNNEAYSKTIRDSHQKHVEDAKPPEGKFAIELREKQKALTGSLKKLIPYGFFYFAYDIKKNEIIKPDGIGGIQKWLGIDENSFTIDIYNDLFHPALKAMQGFYARGLVKALNSKYIDTNGVEKSIVLDIEKVHFNYTQAIKKGIDKDEYWFVKRTLIPYIYTNENRLLGWLNIFSIINDYENHPFIFQNSSLTNEEVLHIKNCSLGNISRKEQVDILSQMLSEVSDTVKDRTHTQSRKTIDKYIRESIDILNCYASLAKEKRLLVPGNIEDVLVISAQAVAERLRETLIANLKNPNLLVDIGCPYKEKYVTNHNAQILKAIDKKFSYDPELKQSVCFNKKQMHVFREITDFVHFLMVQSILPLND